MKSQRSLWIVGCLLALALSVFPTEVQSRFPSHPGFQVSTLAALDAGVYQGAATVAELKRHGNFGLGTFEGLDGEMVMLDGKVYQIKADGVAGLIADGVRTPFAAVTFFHPEQSLRLDGAMTYEQLQQQITQQLPTSNLPYAIRLRGTFPYLKVRSGPKQTPPYRPLKEVKQQQRVFEWHNVRGTLVGFRLPPFLKRVNVAGYHFHLITSDRKAGGHLLDGEFLNLIAEVEPLRDWQMRLPHHPAFEQAKLE
jgi:acetolactate decarboxylase